MARTASLTAAEQALVSELDMIANSSMIYKDNLGTYTAVSLGASGTVLQGNGATSAPSFGEPIFLDSVFKIRDDATGSPYKTLAFDCSQISTGQTSLIVIPDADGTMCLTSNVAILSNKTFVAPKITDGGFIADPNGNEYLVFNQVGSAVNQLDITNAATGTNPIIGVSGDDSNIGMNFRVKGTGVYRFLATTSGPTDMRWFEDADNGTNYVSIIAPATLSGDFVLTLPAATDTLVGKATTDNLTNKELTSATVTTKISPTTDDGAPLGDTTHNFSDLFLASGAVINYANGNVVITQTSGILTMGTGTLKITNPTNTTTSVVTIDATQTITNKRNQPRIVSAASYTTDTGTSLDFSTCDIFIVTAQAGALKFNNPSGTPQHGEKIIIRVKDNGTARALTYDTQYRAVGVTLPTTTVISKTLYLGGIWNATDTKLDIVAVAQEA